MSLKKLALVAYLPEIVAGGVVVVGVVVFWPAIKLALNIGGKAVEVVDNVYNGVNQAVNGITPLSPNASLRDIVLHRAFMNITFYHPFDNFKYSFYDDDELWQLYQKDPNNPVFQE